MSLRARARARWGRHLSLRRLRRRIGSWLNGGRFGERLVQKLARSIGVVQLAQFGKAFVTTGTVIYDIKPILSPMVKPFLRSSIRMLNAWEGFFARYYPFQPRTEG